MYSVLDENKYIYVNRTANLGGAFTMDLQKRGEEVSYSLNVNLESTTSRGSKFSFTDNIELGTYDAVIFEDGNELVKFTIYYTKNEYIPSIYE